MDINGTEDADVLVGTADPDRIFGLGGNDSLDGGLGADELEGGTGDDTYIVDNGGDIVRELLGGGTDTIKTSVSYTLAAGVEVEILTTRTHAGTDAITLIGNAFAQTLVGNAGANTLDGRGGADVMAGLAGNDTYVVDRLEDQVLENIGGGNDTVFTAISFVLSSNQEIETLTTQTHAGTDNLFLTGNQLNNILIGNAGNNLLNGNAGADTMYGLAGNDTYVIDNAGDLVIDLVGQGNDVVLTHISHTLSNGNEIETLSTVTHSGTTAINLGGSDYDNTIIGNYGANYINGGGGVDRMIGLNGDDTYVVENVLDTVEEIAGGGNDTLFSFVSYTLAAGQQVEAMSTAGQGATTAINLTGNELAQIIVGNAGANVLSSGGGTDTFYGLGGADTFALSNALVAGNLVTIADFNVADDTIQLGGAAGQPFASLATGSLRAGTLAIGTAAADADDYLIYNSGTGALLFDADGNGAGVAVQIATLATGLGLTVADFVVTGLANNAPSVTSGGTASIAENTAASTIVYQTAATDADGDRITYSLSGTDAGLLTIDANGAVRLIAPANFEVKASYTFNVLVSDSGATTTRAVTLTITDVNESGPPTPIINETASANDTRLTAQAIDPGTFLVADNVNLRNDDFPSATIVGSVSVPEDVDWYSITLTAGQQLILDVDFTSGGLDSFLTLYGPNGGTVIGDNDDLITPDTGSNPPFPHNTDSMIIFRAAVSGTYYFSIESFSDAQGPTSSGGYQINVSINAVPATPQQIMAEDVEALISGAFWTDTSLTFGFPTSAADYPQDFDEVNPATDFEAFTPGQQAATRSLLQLIANVSPLTFTENTTQGPHSTPGTAANADLRFAESSEADVAYAYYPSNGGSGSEGGSAWFNKTAFNTPVKGNYAWMGILHEIGHALGLKHGHEFPLAISADHDSVEYSVMTYRSYPGDDAEGYGNEQYGYPQTLMMLDIAALQKIYDGANYLYNASDTIYTWDNLTGEMSINGAAQGAPGGGSVSASTNRILMTIWDGNGNDTYDLSNYNTNTTIDLRPGEWTTTDPAQLANLRGGAGGPYYARGNIANALLFEDDIRSAIENAKGGAGADTLIANLVANRFTGNGGADIFKWMATGDAGTGGLADTVLDFVRGTDKLDFTALDAQPGTAGQQDFAFIGTGAFTNVAGQVRYEVTGGNANIFADVDGNGSADMQIVLTGITTLAASDFNF